MGRKEKTHEDRLQSTYEMVISSPAAMSLVATSTASPATCAAVVTSCDFAASALGAQLWLQQLCTRATTTLPRQ